MSTTYVEHPGGELTARLVRTGEDGAGTSHLTHTFTIADPDTAKEQERPVVTLGEETWSWMGRPEVITCHITGADLLNPPAEHEDPAVVALADEPETFAVASEAILDNKPTEATHNPVAGEAPVEA